MGDALHLHFSDIKKHAWSIFYLAVIAVALSITVGASLQYFNVFEGLTLGAYVSLFAINMATDAVSVQSVLSRFKGISHDIKVLIEGESLGNDATAVIAFFFIGLPWMMNGEIDAGQAAMDALRVFIVSIGIGLVVGYIFFILMKLFSDKRGELFAFIILTSAGIFSLNTFSGMFLFNLILLYIVVFFTSPFSVFAITSILVGISMSAIFLYSR
jgi:CPA1 family monovalent cation:H+ antiporter